MSVTVDILSNRLPPMPANLRAGAADITQLAVHKVHERADPNTPRDTGDLASNVVVGPDFVHWTMGYAFFVDKGTVHMAGTLFATSAADQVRPEWIQALSQIEGRL